MALTQSFLQTEIETPPLKRRRLEVPVDGHCIYKSVCEIVLHQSKEVRKYLNINEVLYKTLLSHEISFVTPMEREKIWGYIDANKPHGEVAARILSLLDSRTDESTREDDFCRFVACVVIEDKHRGHQELAKIFKAKIDHKDWEKIRELGKAAKSHRTLSDNNNTMFCERVLHLSDDIRSFLNVNELLQKTLSRDIRFVTPMEREKIWDLIDANKTHSEVAARILSLLDSRTDESTREDDFCRFVACVVIEDDHSGHSELADIFKENLECNDWLKVQNISKQVSIVSPLPSPYVTPVHSPVASHDQQPLCPEKPVPLITLQGQLVQREFLETETKLWLAFSTGNYKDLEVLTKDIQFHVQCGTYNSDCKIVAMWFEALIMMHRDGMYNGALELLQKAESLSKDCENETILRGRIHQRMAQICLMIPDNNTDHRTRSSRKSIAANYFKMAKEELQFVGRGYDKTNMYCREAKILSATEPHKRTDIEKVYEKALGTLEKDDPYFLASFPSVSLSKVAFHLHFAFGAEPKTTYVSAADIKKARTTLRNVNEAEHILIDMRQREYKFIVAELCRLEGKYEEAHLRFKSIIDTADNKVCKVLCLAGHRLELCESQMQPSFIYSCHP